MYTVLRDMYWITRILTVSLRHTLDVIISCFLLLEMWVIGNRPCIYMKIMFIYAVVLLSSTGELKVCINYSRYRREWSWGTNFSKTTMFLLGRSAGQGKRPARDPLFPALVCASNGINSLLFTGHKQRLMFTKFTLRLVRRRSMHPGSRPCRSLQREARSCPVL